MSKTKEEGISRRGKIPLGQIYTIGAFVLSALILSSLWLTIKLLIASAVAVVFFQLGKTGCKLLSDTFFSQNNDKQNSDKADKCIDTGIAAACFLSSVLLLNTMLYTSFLTTLVFCGTLIFLHHGSSKELIQPLEKFSDNRIDDIRSFISGVTTTNSKSDKGSDFVNL